MNGAAGCHYRLLVAEPSILSGALPEVRLRPDRQRHGHLLGVWHRYRSAPRGIGLARRHRTSRSPVRSGFPRFEPPCLRGYTPGLIRQELRPHGYRNRSRSRPWMIRRPLDILRRRPWTCARIYGPEPVNTTSNPAKSARSTSPSSFKSKPRRQASTHSGAAGVGGSSEPARQSARTM